MGFPGSWMTESGSLAYRVVPKCACSTIGQIMYFTDHGQYFDGDIHDATDGLVKWGTCGDAEAMSARIRAGLSTNFTCVRNPFHRILSAFFDKICGIQRNGGRYRGNLVPLLGQKYGVEVDGDFDQIRSFRRFLLFARDTVKWRRPMPPDIHWSDMAGHVGSFVAGGGRYGHIVTVEDFEAGMQRVLDAATLPHPLRVADVPRFNESSGHGPKRAHPVAEFFDDFAVHLVYEMYHRDFLLFGYDPQDPGRRDPVRPIDLNELHIRLRDG